VPRKTASQLDHEIARALAKPSTKERRQAAAQERRQHAQDADTAWRREILDQIKSWVEESWAAENVPQAERHYPYNTIIKRLSQLMTFIRVFFPETTAAPFDAYDAAALIVLPRWQALRLARKLFGGGPGIAKDLHEEDLSYNMNWFRPANFQ
jgi:hypothetical protein